MITCRVHGGGGVNMQVVGRHEEDTGQVGTYQKACVLVGAGHDPHLLPLAVTLTPAVICVPSQHFLSHHLGWTSGTLSGIGPCSSLAGNSRAKCYDILPLEPPTALWSCRRWTDALSALTSLCVTHRHADTYFVWTHCLQCQGPIPIQRVRRDRRTGAV